MALKDHVLIVSTSASKLDSAPTGLWLEELASPYYIFKKAGYSVTIASVSGGKIPIDKNSLSDDYFTDYAKQFQKDEEAQQAFNNSIAASDIVQKKAGVKPAEDYAAIYVPGGHGIVTDGNDASLTKLIENFSEQGRVVGTVCHGIAALLYPQKTALTSAGKVPFLQGEEVTGFSDAEEQDVKEISSHMPHSLEAKIGELGGTYKKGPEKWGSFVVTSGRLVTGQNPQSSEAVAGAIIHAIKTNSLYVAGYPVAAVT